MFAAGFPAIVPEIIPELADLSFALARCLPFVLALVVGNNEFSVAMRRQQLLKAVTERIHLLRNQQTAWQPV